MFSKNFDFVITIIPSHNYGIVIRVLLSIVNSKILHDNILMVIDLLSKHYIVEQQTTKFVQYNAFCFTGPVNFTTLLNYKYSTQFRVDIKKVFNENTVTFDLPQFKYYNCGIMDVNKYLRFYGCNMKHHHGENFHKHWSRLQTHQKLFLGT